jgi:hypothetical protein
MVSGAAHTQHTILPALNLLKQRTQFISGLFDLFMCLEDRVSVLGIVP